MELTILTQENFDQLISKLDIIIEHLKKENKYQDMVLDNADFLRYMKISRRTACSWRAEGLINFSQMGSKIYYKLSDVEEFLDRYKRRSFKNLRKYKTR